MVQNRPLSTQTMDNIPTRQGSKNLDNAPLIISHTRTSPCKNLETVFGNPHKMIAMIKCTVLAFFSIELMCSRLEGGGANPRKWNLEKSPQRNLATSLENNLCRQFETRFCLNVFS